MNLTRLAIWNFTSSLPSYLTWLFLTYSEQSNFTLAVVLIPAASMASWGLFFSGIGAYCFYKKKTQAEELLE